MSDKRGSVDQRALAAQELKRDGPRWSVKRCAVLAADDISLALTQLRPLFGKAKPWLSQREHLTEAASWLRDALQHVDDALLPTNEARRQQHVQRFGPSRINRRRVSR